MRADATVSERILLAAYALSQRRPAFSAEELVVEAWQRSPEQFGLQGFSDKHPDSNKVLTKIMGTAGLRGKGWLEKIGEKRYRLTESGKAAASNLESSPKLSSTSVRVTELRRELVPVLIRMLDAPALTKFREQLPLTFSDVCSFWNISARSTASQFINRTKDADHAVAETLRIASAAKTSEVGLPGNIESVSVVELTQLQELAAMIREQFAAEIAIMLGRSDERKL